MQLAFKMGATLELRWVGCVGVRWGNNEKNSAPKCSCCSFFKQATRLGKCLESIGINSFSAVGNEKLPQPRFGLQRGSVGRLKEKTLTHLTGSRMIFAENLAKTIQN
jgi:hypothetical protein